MITSPNLGLKIPQIGADNDPAWETEVIYSFNKIDAHTHDGAGNGIKIPFNNLNFTSATPSLANNPLIGASYYQMQQQSTLLTVSPAGTGSFQIDTSGNLYYVSTTNRVLISSATAINYNAASKGFVGSVYGTTNGAANYFGTGSEVAPGTGNTYGQSFAFYTGTAGTANTTLATGIYNTLVLKGTNPTLELFDTGTGNNTQAMDFGSLGNLPSGSVTMFGYLWKTKNSTNLYSSQFFVTAVNNLYTGSLPSSSTGVVPWVFYYNDSPTLYAATFGYAQNFTFGYASSSTVGGNYANHTYYKQYFSNAAGVSSAPTFPFGMNFYNYIQTTSSPTGQFAASIVSTGLNNATLAGSSSGGDYSIRVGASGATGNLDGGVWSTIMQGSVGRGNVGGSNTLQVTLGSGIDAAVSALPYMSNNYGIGLPLNTYANAVLPGSSTASLGASGANQIWPSAYIKNLTVSGTVSFASAAAPFYSATSAASPVASATGYFSRANSVVSVGTVAASTGSGTPSGFNVGSYSWSGNTCTIVIGTSLANTPGAPILVTLNGGVAGTTTYQVQWINSTSFTVVMSAANTFFYAVIGSAA